MRIQFLNGENAGTWRDIEAEGVGIGRETDNGIQLLAERVSRYHARLERHDDGWFLLDLGSTNGTRLNGKVIAGSARLRDGDVVAVGEITFRIAEADTTPRQEKETAEPAFVFRPPEDRPSAGTAAPSPASDPQNKSQPEKKEPAKDLSRAIPDLDHLFDREASSRTASAEDPAKSSPNKRRIVNLLYLLLLVSVAAVSLFIFVEMQEQKSGDAQQRNRVQAPAIPNPFFVFYEKREITKNNGVFCFRLLLENDRLSFSLDDLLSGRVYSPTITDPVRPEAIEKLKKAISETNFMTSEQQEQLGDTSENNKSCARLVVGFDDKFNDITVQDIVLTSFTRVEAAIRDFLQEEYGLDPSMAESRDELIREARSLFDLAEKQYGSYKTQPENLWRSIENYKIAMRRYEVFAEKPPEWAAARTHLAEAEEALRQIRETGHDMVNLYYQQREFRKAMDECTRLMEFFPQDSDTYRNIRSMKIKLENLMSKDR